MRYLNKRHIWEPEDDEYLVDNYNGNPLRTHSIARFFGLKPQSIRQRVKYMVDVLKTHTLDKNYKLKKIEQ